MSTAVHLFYIIFNYFGDQYKLPHPSNRQWGTFAYYKTETCATILYNKYLLHNTVPETSPQPELKQLTGVIIRYPLYNNMQHNFSYEFELFIHKLWNFQNKVEVDYNAKFCPNDMSLSHENTSRFSSDISLFYETNCTKLELQEKILAYELLVTLFIKIIFKKKFSIELCLREIIYYSDQLFKVVKINVVEFTLLQKKINGLVCNNRRTFQIKELKWSDNFLSMLYFTIIIRSLIVIRSSQELGENLSHNAGRLLNRGTFEATENSNGRGEASLHGDSTVIMIKNNIISRESLVSSVKTQSRAVGSAISVNNFWKKIIRMIIGLTDIDCIERIVQNRNSEIRNCSKKYKSQIFLRLNFEFLAPINHRIVVNCSFSEFELVNYHYFGELDEDDSTYDGLANTDQLSLNSIGEKTYICQNRYDKNREPSYKGNIRFGKYLLGASYLSTYPLIKKSKNQKFYNALSINNVIKLSKMPFRVSKSDWGYWKKILLSSLKKESILFDKYLIGQGNTSFEEIFIRAEERIKIKKLEFNAAQSDAFCIKIDSSYSLVKKLLTLVQNYPDYLSIFSDDEREIITSIISNQISSCKQVNSKLFSGTILEINQKVIVLLINTILPELELSKIAKSSFIEINRIHSNIAEIVYQILFNNLIKSTAWDKSLEEKSKIQFLKFALNGAIVGICKLFPIDNSIFLNKINRELGFKKAYKIGKVIKELNAEFQKWQYLVVVERAFNMDRAVYLNYFKDFRGRLYSNSLFHPMYNKPLRLFITLGGETSDENINEIKLSVYFKNISKYFKYVNIPSLNEYLRTEYDIYIISLILLELGKLNKSELLLQKNGGYSLTMEEFLREGTAILNRVMLLTNEFGGIDNRFLDALSKEFNVENALSVMYYLKQIEHFINFNSWPNFNLERDATGSTFQLWAILLGVREGEGPDILNLRGEVWCDIYYWIILQYVADNQKFITSLKLDTSKIFKRTYWKRTIMTLNYNVTLYRSLEYFLDSLGTDYDPKYYTEYSQLHKSFYNYVNDRLFDKLYKKTKDTWIYEFSKGLLDMSLIDKTPDFITDAFVLNRKNERKALYYNNVELEKIDQIIKFKSTKWKFSSKKLGSSFDKRSTKRSLPANTIQSLDAELVSYMISNVSDIYTIHDCVICSSSNVHNVMTHLNKFFIKETQFERGVDQPLFIFL